MPNGGQLTCPFTVIVDTREQSPFAFASIQADANQGRRSVTVPTQRGTLQQGDYSILGMERWIAVERKSLADLFGTLAQGRKRFEAELQRLQTMAFAAVVIEGDWMAILRSPPRHSRLNPKTVFRSVVAWTQRFKGVHWFPCPSRSMAEVATFRILERFWKDRQPQREPRRSIMEMTQPRS